MRRASIWRLCGLALISIAACTTPSPSDSGTQATCTDDDDCGAQRFCTAAMICRTDCYADLDCLTLGSGAECNAHGACVAPATFDAAAAVEAAPSDEVSDDDTGDETGNETGDEAGVGP